MKWLELTFATTHEAAELITDFLSVLGADGVQIQDDVEISALLNAPDSLADAGSFLADLDGTVQIKAYFAETEQGVRCNRELDWSSAELYDDVPKRYLPLASLEALIRSHLAQFAAHLAVGAGYTGWQVVHEEDWAEGWKQYYQTLSISRRVVINPSWIDYQAAPGEIVVTLDPGSAFGTGTHETTALCAEWIDQLLIPGDRVLDLGTGSGILAIIAARLGAGAVEAIDIDQLAVDVAQANCQQNQVAVDVHQGVLADARFSVYDLLVANIIADVLIGLMTQMAGKLSPDGLLVASGIISEKRDAVLAAATAAGLAWLAERERGDWVALVLKRPAPAG